MCMLHIRHKVLIFNVFNAEYASYISVQIFILGAVTGLDE